MRKQRIAPGRKPAPKKKPRPARARVRRGKNYTVVLDVAGAKELNKAIENDWRALAAEAISVLREVANDTEGELRSFALRKVSGLERKSATLAGQLEMF